MGKTVVVGGHSRNIGKTSVVAGIISGIPEPEWTAVKITQFGHGVCSINGKSCHCSTEQHRFAIQQERDKSGRTDTSRFLVAGAKKSLWVRTKQGMLFEAMPQLRKLIANEPYVIMESNSMLRFLKPDLYLVVLDYATSDFKASAKQFLDRADAFILVERIDRTPSWEGISLKPLTRKPVFRILPGVYVTPEVIQFVRERISL
jgi:hypothetical protein